MVSVSMTYKTQVRALNLQQSIQKAMALQSQGKHRAAAKIYRTILKAIPDQFEALHFLGILHAQQNNFGKAAKLFASAIDSEPSSYEAHNNLGNAYRKLDRPEDALACYRKAIALEPNFAEAHYNLGLALMALKHYEEAVRSYEQSLSIRPSIPQVYNNLGGALRALRRVEDAIACYETAIRLKPDFSEAYNNLGNALQMANRHHDAVELYGKAIELRPDSADYRANLGSVLLSLSEYFKAEASFEKALELDPKDGKALNGLGQSLLFQRRYESAIAVLRRADKRGLLDPTGLALLVRARRECCDWRDIESLEDRVVHNVRNGNTGTDPFTFFYIADSAADQSVCARQLAGRRPAAPVESLCNGQIYNHDRLRIGYLSADFHDHPTSQLAVQLFEFHDRDRFETYAFSCGIDDGSAIRQRIKRAFDHFIDARELSAVEAAEKIGSLEIDVLVDLSGYTMNSRLDILSHRPAAIQAHYLAYPGTLQTDFVDYMFVDGIVVPTDHGRYYSEQLVYLPDCYQISDDKRQVSEHTPSRKELDLPEDGVVFCSFNNSYKFTPRFFDIWIRLLHAVPGSVLWLLADHETVENNLRQEAEHRGIEAARIVFAPRVSTPDHLARMRQGDLFLDCLPCGAHTTANEALWVGLPVLTVTGQAFAGRVAASLLQTMEMPELVAATPEDYEAKALQMATQPGLLKEIRDKIARNRQRTPLFDSRRFTRHMEAAYLRMHDIAKKGEKPQPFSVSPTS